jgi:SAM-dependent methyltransferase
MAQKHFIEQKQHAEQYLIPYLREKCPGLDGFRVLEIGCAEGGFLSALTEIGIRATGLELSPGRVALAKSIEPGLDVRIGDATDPAVPGLLDGLFDLVVMRDVVEHVADREALFENLRRLLKRGGYAYITFPPKQSPFAGHHQNGRSALRFIPYLHLLPWPLLRFLGKRMGETPHIIEDATANFRNGLSIHDFQQGCKKHGFRFICKEFFLIRPVYKTRFGLRPVRICDIPLLRETLATGCECLVQMADNPLGTPGDKQDRIKKHGPNTHTVSWSLGLQVSQSLSLSVSQSPSLPVTKSHSPFTLHASQFTLRALCGLSS